MIRIKLLTKTAKLPTRGTLHAAGLDLYADEDICVMPITRSEHPVARIKTGIALELTPGWEAQVRGRSGLTSRGLIVHLGTIDADYRGEVSVMLTNISASEIRISRGDRIAQLVVASYDVTHPVNVDTLSETLRGHGGFGSTGN